MGRGHPSKPNIKTVLQRLIRSQVSSQVGLVRIIRSVHKKGTDDQNQMLTKKFKVKEIKEAMFSMNPDKSPGPDGMNPGFYQAYWDIIGGEVTEACLKVLNNKELPADCLKVIPHYSNPEEREPEKISEMRPIALCNVLYKIIAKTLANRLKCILSEVISESQSAFILGRLITDNIMIAFKLGYHIKRKKGHVQGI